MTDPATLYLRWTFVTGALARGYWVVTALYLVVVADLTPAQLILIGTFQGIAVLLSEIPAGVLADAVSRRRSIVIGHVIRGTGMAMAGMVTSFPLLVVSQCLWGLGWAFSSGADVAWVTDELARPELIDRVLVGAARWDLVGRTFGIVLFAGLAWATSLATAIVATGAAMVLLGVGYVARWPETGFVPVEAGRRWHESATILRSGLRLARLDRVILAVLAATFIIDGGMEGYGRLLEKRLVALGMPTHPDPIVWFGAVALVGYVLGAAALRVVETRIAGAGVAKRTYVLVCAVGALGVALFANAPNTASAVLGSLIVGGVARPVITATGAIWINRRTPSAVRSTVHSMLSQAEHAGEVVFGVTLAALAGYASATAVLMTSAALLAAAGVLIQLTPDRPVNDG